MKSTFKATTGKTSARKGLKSTIFLVRSAARARRSCHAMLHEYIKEYGPMYQKVIEETVSELRNAIDPISRKYVEKQSDILAVFLSQMDKTAWTKIQRITRILLDSFPLRWREVPKLTYSYGSGPSIHVESIKKGAAMRRNKQKRGGSHD